MTTQARGNAERQFSVPTVEILTLETPKPKAAPAAAAANPASVTAPKRCLHRFANGKRCRQSGLESQAGICSHHFRLSHPSVVFPPSPSDSEDLSADLLPEPTDFSFADDVQRFLARLVTQVTKGRVSPRRAAVLGYLTSQILHSHRAIDLDKELQNEPQQFLFDLPHPKRDEEPVP